jgi:hypothetical protein
VACPGEGGKRSVLGLYHGVEQGECDEGDYERSGERRDVYSRHCGWCVEVYSDIPSSEVVSA